MNNIKSKTRHGNYNDLSKSEYTHETDKFIFYFNSEYRKDLFKKRLKENYNHLEKKMLALYGIPVNLKEFNQIYTYKETENRGFYIFHKKEGVHIEWVKHIILDGVMKTQKNLQD